MDIKKIILLILTILIGVGLSIYSVIKIKEYNEKNKTYIETTATVVDYETSIGEDGDELAAIIVEYKVERNSYQLKSTSSSNHPKPIGSKVKVKYNPTNPSEAIFSNDKSNIILLIAGLLFAGFGTYGLIYTIKNKD